MENNESFASPKEETPIINQKLKKSEKKEPTKVMRIPISKIETVKKVIGKP